MAENDVWPPKPDLPNPLTEYNDVIATKVAALSETKAGPSRILLIKALRDEEGMGLRQAFALSKSYCDRHSLFVAALCVVAFGGYLVEARHAVILRQPHHHAALLALDRQQTAIVAAIMVLMIGVAATIVITEAISRRRE